jgi:putative transposase
MAYGVNVVENIDWLEVYDGEEFDQPRSDPHQIQEQLKNQMQHQLKHTLEEALEWERDLHVQALRYERGTAGRQDYRNGYRQRDLSTTMGSVTLRVPRCRQPIDYATFDVYQRRWQDLDALLLEAHIGGMSCRDVGDRIAKLLGRRWCGATIAALKDRLTERLKSFRNMPLKDEYVALVVDGMYVGIRQCLERKRPVVAVIGVKADGSVDLLAFRVCYTENSTEVEGLLGNIKERGVRGHNLQVVTIDGDKGLEAAVYAVYGQVRIQDCVFHRINRIYQNATAKTRGKKMMTEASEAFSESNPRTQRRMLKDFCDKWREKEPKAVERFEHNLQRCFEAQVLPPAARARATTSGLCEGLFSQIRDRINAIGFFETPMAVELYIFAIVAQKKWIGIPGRSQAAPLLELFTHKN